jgi:hypothetical protein
LVRCEFLEIVIRIAIAKFFEKKICKTEAEALDKLFTDHISKKYNYNKMCQATYRRTQYWNEKVDNILKAFKPVFWHLFMTYGGTTKRPGEAHFMIASEFNNLVNDAHFINDLFPAIKIPLMFNLAQVTVKNELTTNEQSRFNFIEFLEALTRIMEETSLAPHNYSGETEMAADLRSS